MEKLSGLTVIECDNCETLWRITRKGDGYEIHDPIRTFQQRRDVELFHLCGVYGRAGVPFSIKEINYEKYKEYRPSDGVLKNYSDLVCQALKGGNAVLIPTGYCMYAPAVAGGIQRAIGSDKKIGVVWINAHADNHIIEEEDTATFVGLPVSCLAGQTRKSWTREICGLEVPCDGKNMLLSDIRICSETALRNMERAEMIHLTISDFKDPEVWDKAVGALAERVDAIYLSVDMDILKNEYTPAYIKCVPGGHTVETVMRNIEAVMETGKVLAFSVFCADFDRYEQQGEWTYLNAMKLIASGLRSWKNVVPDGGKQIDREE